MVLNLEQENIIFIPQERCNVGRQQKISRSIQLFPTFLSRGMIFKLEKLEYTSLRGH